MIAIYDGTFEGYLSLVYDVYYKKISLKAIVKERPQTLLLDEVYEVVYDEVKSQKVLKALQTRFTKENFSTILNSFMCDNSAFEMPLLEFIVLGFKEQRNLQNINLEAVLSIKNLQKELFRNVHKMSGFLRFEELEDGSLYAKVESKFNLLYFLGSHFSKRFSNQTYFIHDLKRSLVFIHSKEFTGIKEVADFEAPTLSKEEQKFKNLWKTFFASVVIESRKNEKLQQSLTPLIYRVYMSEFES